MLFFRHRLHLGVGIFSKFKKKGESGVDDDEAAARRAANGQQERERLSQAELQREIARATAMKIDAIEAAMAADIFDEPEPVFRRPPRPPGPAAADDHYPTELLEDQDTPAEAAAAESAPLVEEVAILYASGESQAAAQLLRDGLGAQDRMLWWMLFDLYQVLGRQEDFDSLSIGYASTFETSPPPWNPPRKASAHSGPAAHAALSGPLDEEAADQIGRLREAAAGAQLLQLDLSGVTRAEPVGCALLLQALREIERPGLQLVLRGVASLSARLRTGREEGEAPWLLLLELLRLQNHEREFEEASMDYCVTFEVSPPPFVPPVQLPDAPAPAAGGAGDRFVLPEVIKSDDDALLADIAHYAISSPAPVFDCARLARIEFTATTQLLARLQPSAGRIEFRALNHLVAALLRLVGLGSIAGLHAHRY